MLLAFKYFCRTIPLITEQHTNAFDALYSDLFTSKSAKKLDLFQDFRESLLFSSGRNYDTTAINTNVLRFAAFQVISRKAIFHFPSKQQNPRILKFSLKNQVFSTTIVS